MTKTKPQDYYAEIRKLSSGGNLSVERMPSMESFTLGFFLPVGASHESKKLNGISHFIEHMLFKGSKKRSARAIVKSIERVGGIINASTGREVTYFYCRVAAKRMDLALDVLSDLVFNPAFDRAALEREKGVILEEIHMNEDDPGQALYDRYLMSIHGNTPYGRPILGRADNIVKFNKKAILDYHNTNYHQGRLVASIAGGIDPDRAQSILEKRLGRYPIKKKKGKRTQKPPVFNPSVKVVSKDVEQAALIIGFPSTSILDPERYSYSLLDAILAGGMMSRLFQEIREKRGLVYSIDSAHQPFNKGGLFTIEAGMREENLLTVLKLCLRVLRQLADEVPGKRELADTKLFLRGHWALGLESTSSRMIRNAMSSLFFNRLLKHEEVVEKLQAVTADDVAKAARKAFKNSGPAVGALSRFENGEGISKIEDQINAIRRLKGRANNNSGRK